MDSKSWKSYFIEMAQHVASKSKDTTKVGCVITGFDEEILSTGFNGIPRGVEDTAKRLERPTKYLWVSHAEENAVAHAARVGTSLKGGIAYVTHAPCARCSRLLIQAGVRKVIVGGGSLSPVTAISGEEFEVSRVMFEEANIPIMVLNFPLDEAA